MESIMYFNLKYKADISTEVAHMNYIHSLTLDSSSFCHGDQGLHSPN